MPERGYPLKKKRNRRWRCRIFAVFLTNPRLPTNWGTEAGCDDGVLASHEGVVSVSFGRRASSLEQAITSAVEELTAAGIQVIGVETDEQALVNQLNHRLFAEAS